VRKTGPELTFVHNCMEYVRLQPYDKKSGCEGWGLNLKVRGILIVREFWDLGV